MGAKTLMTDYEFYSKLLTKELDCSFQRPRYYLTMVGKMEKIVLCTRLANDPDTCPYSSSCTEDYYGVCHYDG